MSTTTDNHLNDLLADGPIAALHFHTGHVQALGGTSRAVRTFIGELTAALVGAAPKKPLIITSERAHTAIFRYFGRAELQNRYGRTLRINSRFADVDPHGDIHFEAQFAGELNSTIEFPDGGAWLDRSPLTVPRHELPVFDSQRVSEAVEALLARWTAAGKIVDIEQPAIRVRPSDIEPYRAPTDGEPSRIHRFTRGEIEAMRLAGVEDLPEPAAARKEPAAPKPWREGVMRWITGED